MSSFKCPMLERYGYWPWRGCFHTKHHGKTRLQTHPSPQNPQENWTSRNLLRSILATRPIRKGFFLPNQPKLLTYTMAGPHFSKKRFILQTSKSTWPLGLHSSLKRSYAQPFLQLAMANIIQVNHWKTLKFSCLKSQRIFSKLSAMPTDIAR